ncbi:MAG: (Na+)-NQR maturation NqrM [Planctomycetota bacterium]
MHHVFNFAPYGLDSIGLIAAMEQQTPPTMGRFLLIFAVTVGALLIVIAAMAVGVIFGRRSISGSCGGIANERDADGNISCSLCSDPANACEDLQQRMQS